MANQTWPPYSVNAVSSIRMAMVGASLDNWKFWLAAKNRAASGKTFATSEEKIYPWILCRRIADIVLRTLMAKGFQAPPGSMQPGASAQHVIYGGFPKLGVPFWGSL